MTLMYIQSKYNYNNNIIIVRFVQFPLPITTLLRIIQWWMVLQSKRISSCLVNGFGQQKTNEKSPKRVNINVKCNCPRMWFDFVCGLFTCRDLKIFIFYIVFKSVLGQCCRSIANQFERLQLKWFTLLTMIVVTWFK